MTKESEARSQSLPSLLMSKPIPCSDIMGARPWQGPPHLWEMSLRLEVYYPRAQPAQEWRLRLSLGNLIH